MRYIGIIILLVLCLTSLLLTGCAVNTVKPESVTVYPQQWATGDGTVENPWANDCIQKAYDAVPVGGTIFLKEGYYTLSAQLSINKQINIIGEGMNKTIIKTADATGFSIWMTDYVTLKGFTVDGDAQTNGTQYLSPIALADCDYALLEDIEVKNGGYYGICPFQVNYSSFQNIYAHDNYRHGVHPGADTVGWNKYNTYRDIYCWDNGVGGFDDRGNTADPKAECYNVYDNINCWGNGEWGILFDEMSNCVVSNSFASENGTNEYGEKYGIYIYGVENFNIHDCFVTLNALEGIYIKDSKNVNFTNVIIKNNNVSDTDGIGGVVINNSSGIKFTSSQSYDDRDTPLQRYGLQLTGTITDISLLNCKLTPNSLGEIYNPTGAEVTVITEKR